jgi:pilus assembly protein Flp/PilA
MILGKYRFSLRGKEGEMLKRFFRDEAGASSVEYCLLVGFIALVIVAGITTLGNRLNSTYASMATSIGS